MIRDGHIGRAEGLTLLFLTLLPRSFLAAPSLLLPLGLTASWLLVLLGTGAAGLIFYLIVAALARCPGQTLWVVLEKGLGYFGILANLTVLGFLLVNVTFSLREYSETFKMALLPETPLAFLGLGLSVLMVYGSYQGLETLARTALAWALPVCLGVIAVILLLGEHTEFALLTPFWGPGPLHLLREIPPAAGLQAEVFLIPTLMSSFRKTSEATGAGLGGLAVAGLIMAAVTGLFVAVFGVEGAMNIHFPLYQMARLIYRGRYLQRVEAVFVLFWILGSIMALAIQLYIAARGLAETLRLPYYKPLVFPLALLVYVSSFLLESYWSLLRLQTSYQWPRFWALLAVVPLAWLAAWRSSRRRQHES